MTVDKINVEEAIASARTQLDAAGVPPATKAAMDVIFLLLSILIARLGLNSRNSSKPPSQDPNREKKRRPSSKKDDQSPRTGTTLQQTDIPDEIIDLPVDRTSLPPGDFADNGYEARQVFDVDIAVVVTEYRAQKLRAPDGRTITAPFPSGIDGPVQYGNGIKAQAVYLSQYQLLPYERTAEHFADTLRLPVSTGSIQAYNAQTYALLESFEEQAKRELLTSPVNHSDETGVNISGKNRWIHCLSNAQWTLLQFHPKRGKEAMDAGSVLPLYRGTLVHDHWKPYYQYEHITHALCNAHHLRELEHAVEFGKQQWADTLRTLLLDMNAEKENRGRGLTPEEAAPWKERYRALLREAERECPPPDPLPEGQRKRGRMKKSKERNLLERLRDYEADVLRFLEYSDVPFTNNQGERDLRMTKVHQKISGCFRSEDGAKIFCRIRSYLSTAKKQDMSASYALRALFDGKDIFAGERGGT